MWSRCVSKRAAGRRQRCLSTVPHQPRPIVSPHTPGVIPLLPLPRTTSSRLIASTAWLPFVFVCSVKGGHIDNTNRALRCGTCGCESHEAFCPACGHWDSFVGSRGETTLACRNSKCRGEGGIHKAGVKFFQVYCEVTSAANEKLLIIDSSLFFLGFVNRQGRGSLHGIRLALKCDWAAWLFLRHAIQVTSCCQMYVQSLENTSCHTVGKGGRMVVPGRAYVTQTPRGAHCNLYSLLSWRSSAHSRSVVRKLEKRAGRKGCRRWG